MSRYVFVALVALVACHKDPPQASAPAQPTKNAEQPTDLQRRPRVQDIAIANITPEANEAEMAKEREAFIADAMAFLKMSHDEVLDRTTVHNTGMKDEWAQWEAKGPMTDARIKDFYKQTRNYIFDLGGWHLWDPNKYSSDVALVEELRQAKVKNVLDFGGGVGFNSLLFAKAGFDVTLADLDSVTLKFAMFRADSQKVKMKFWRSDVEPMPPDKKYDAILCLDVLEHLPQAELKTAVDKLVELKTAGTKVIIHAPFGRTATHPMHLDESEETKRQVARLQNDLPH